MREKIWTIRPDYKLRKHGMHPIVGCRKEDKNVDSSTLRHENSAQVNEIAAREELSRTALRDSSLISNLVVSLSWRL